MQPSNESDLTFAAIGMFIERNAEQFSNAPHSMYETEAGITMVSRDEQSQKVQSSIDEIEFGRVTEVKDLQSLKMCWLRVVTVLGITMERSELLAKAPRPMYCNSNDAGNLTESRDWQRWNDHDPIDIRDDGNFIDDNFIQEWNEHFSISGTPSLTSISVTVRLS